MTLPNGFTLRAPNTGDLEGVKAAFDADSEFFGAVSTTTVEELEGYWQEIENLEEDAWVVVAPDGTIAGYEELTMNKDKAGFYLDGVVHAAYQGMGIGSTLLDTGEARVQKLLSEMDVDGKTPYINIQFNGKDDVCIKMMEKRGYKRLKRDILMQITLDEMPDEPVWPEGITVREFVLGQDDRAVFEVVDASFRNIAGYTERASDYDTWHHSNVQKDGFDPTLWFLAVESDGRIVGVNLCPHDKDGWVRQLAILPDYFGKGLGRALLIHSFREWYKRGKTTIGLGVQGDNERAQKLYYGVGMHADSIYDLYAKEL